MKTAWPAALLLLAACSSSSHPKTYKTITCAEFTALAGSSNNLTNGALDMAMAYMNSAPIDPKGGVNDAADFGEQIVAACDTTTGDTPIIDLKSRVVGVFLAKHPQDRL